MALPALVSPVVVPKAMNHILCFSSGTRYNVAPDCPRCAVVMKARARGKGIGGPGWTPPEHPPLSILRVQCLCDEPKAVEIAVTRDSLWSTVYRRMWPRLREELVRAGCGP